MRNGTRLAEYTQPYIDSGLVIVAPVKHITSSAWAFLKPFTWEMWFITGALFILVGIVVWLLEHRSNPEFRGPPCNQVITIFWYVGCVATLSYPSLLRIPGISQNSDWQYHYIGQNVCSFIQFYPFLFVFFSMLSC